MTMYSYKNVTESIFSIGGNDRRLSLFENVYPIPNGISYNSYLIKDSKTALIDTADHSIAVRFVENLRAVLDGARLDYIVINHMEPDHSASLADVLRQFPDASVVCTDKAAVMIGKFLGFMPAKVIQVADGDSLPLGTHTLSFHTAPMVHWPEVMVTYEANEKVLFSADAFGTFGTVDGGLFADEYSAEHEMLPEFRRYYTNIAGKYGSQVKLLLDKAQNLDISYVCPLHGPVWRSKIDFLIEKYRIWSSYCFEERAVMIVYGSIYGNTENAAEILADGLSERGVRRIKMFDASAVDVSYMLSEAFRVSHIVFASSTYNADVFTSVSELIDDLRKHNFGNRTVSLIENGSWAPTSGSVMKKRLSELKDIAFLGDTVRIESAVNDKSRAAIEALADEIAASVIIEKPSGKDEALSMQSIDKTALFSIPYGLFMLSSELDGKLSGCIVNTVIQITENPYRIVFAVNKSGYTCQMLERSGRFAVSVIDSSAPYMLFERFGMSSGRDSDKYEDYELYRLSPNGVPILTAYANAVFSGEIISSEDCGSHILFTARVDYAERLSDEQAMTYAYYREVLRPKPAPKKSGYVCTVCGYVYEGDSLPEDFICPICKHGADVFTKLE